MLVEDVTASIREMRVVEFIYKGTWRTVEPHLLGLHTNGKLCLSAFQLSGGSGEAWRAFLLEGIDSFSPTSESFDGPRPGFNPNDSTMVRVLASI